MSVLLPNVGDCLVADSTSSAKWTKVNCDNIDPLTKGTLTHPQIDTILGIINPMIDVNNKIKIMSISGFNIAKLTNNKAILYNSSNLQWENKTINHDYLNNKGVFGHDVIDSFILSQGKENGVCMLDNNKTGKYPCIRRPNQ